MRISKKNFVQRFRATKKSRVHSRHIKPTRCWHSEKRGNRIDHPVLDDLEPRTYAHQCASCIDADLVIRNERHDITVSQYMLEGRDPVCEPVFQCHRVSVRNELSESREVVETIHFLVSLCHYGVGDVLCHSAKRILYIGQEGKLLA